MTIKRAMTLSTMAGLATVLAACGGGSGSSSTGTGDSGSTGTFSLAITDGPVDSASHVVVQFDGVSIKPAEGEVIEFEFDEPKSLDLLALQGNISAPLVEGVEVPAGDYEWIRLHVSAERDGVVDSYIEIDGAQLELWIPSGAQTGLKLVNGFTVAAGGSADFTIDFDLRKSVTNPPGMPEAILRPALRLVNNMVVGSVSGTIDPSLVSQQCADATTDDGAVYIYSGADVTPSDVSGSESDPLVSALVHYSDDAYSYEFGFLAEGEYTVAYTCDAGTDDPTVVDELSFVGPATVSVAANETTTHDFVLPEETVEEPATDGASE